MSAIVLAVVASTTGRSSTAKSAIAGGRDGASTARGATVHGQTLFGLNVPSLQALDESESALRARPAIIGTFADWEHAPDFPTRTGRGDQRSRGGPARSRGSHGTGTAAPNNPAYALRRILAGDHDALIDRWATQVAAYRRPVLLRFAAEMNGDWRPWSIGLNGNRADEYVATWRHVRERFARAGAANAIWVWNPIIAYDGSTPLRELFPGADEVDWLAVDGYNWGSTRDWGWQSYADIFAPTLKELHKLAPRRPLMIAETGSAPDRRKASWVTDTLDLGTRRRRGRRGLVRVLQRDRLAPVREPGGREGRPHRREAPGVAPRRRPRGRRASREPPAIARTRRSRRPSLTPTASAPARKRGLHATREHRAGTQQNEDERSESSTAGKCPFCG